MYNSVRQFTEYRDLSHIQGFPGKAVFLFYLIFLA